MEIFPLNECKGDEIVQIVSACNMSLASMRILVLLRKAFTKRVKGGQLVQVIRVIMTVKDSQGKREVGKELVLSSHVFIASGLKQLGNARDHDSTEK